MESTNPYEAPEADNIINASESGDFGHLNFKQLQKLYYRSVNVSTIAGLIILGAIGQVSAAIMLPANIETSRGFFIGLAIFCIVVSVGLIMRTSWGRILGIIFCLMMLLSIPLGTIVGIVGLFAFFKAPELFGENRVLHKAIKTEFKYRKKHKLKN